MTPSISPPRSTFALASTFAAALLCILLVAVTPASGGSSIGISIATPVQSATITGSVPWLANVSGKVKTVDFYVDGVMKWTELNAPYEYHFENTDGKLDTKRLADGNHELKVVARAPNGSTATSSITVRVQNSTAPTATTIAPANGATLAGTVTWDTSTTGTITRVVFLVDGVEKWVESLSPYRFNSTGLFPTTSFADGSHTLSVRAEGPTGSSTSSISVKFANKVISSPTVVNTPPSNTALPVVSGLSTVGQALSATTGSWTGTAPLTFASAWERCVSGTCSPIAGASASTYTITTADVGATIRVAVTAKNGYGSATARSAQTTGVRAITAPPVNTALPGVTGTSSVGKVLNGSAGTWTGTAPLTNSFAWERCASGTCSPIAGAASSSYSLTSADAGATVRVAVTATNAAGTAVARSTQTATVTTESAPSVTVGTALPARMPESSGTSYYVDGTTGSDSNPGTLCRALAHASTRRSPRCR